MIFDNLLLDFAKNASMTLMNACITWLLKQIHKEYKKYYTLCIKLIKIQYQKLLS